MNTTSTNGALPVKTSRPAPQLKVRIDFLQPLEPSQAVTELSHPDIRFCYDEKCCTVTFAAFNHPDTSVVKSLEAEVELHNGLLHHGQFAPNRTFDITRNGSLQGVATIVQVLETVYQYWDWQTLPQSFQHFSEPFCQERLECFLLNLEFALVQLPFLEDYTIQKPQTSNYSLDIRLSASRSSLAPQQALMVMDLFKSLPYEYRCLRPGFYQLSASQRLENFECQFIIGSGGHSVSGRLIVL